VIMQKKKHSVLIVDDSHYMRASIRNVLQDTGYHIIGEARNGEEALDMAFELQPDIITLDNTLPDMIGTDILKVFRKRALRSRIIIISAYAQDFSVVEGLSYGADGYLTKPFRPEELLRLVLGD